MNIPQKWVFAVPGVAVTALRESAETGNTAVALDIEVERPQDLAYPIRATEPVAVVFAAQGAQPRVARRFSGYAAPELDTARCAMFAVRR